jgi:alpha-L-fucosidase 2
MKSRAYLIICLLLGIGVAAQAQDCLPVRVGNPDGNYIVPGVLGRIVYRKVAGVELALDAYVQKRGERRPAVVVVHGGNWTTGSRIAFTGQFLEMLTRAGYNWFSIDYRLGRPERYRDALEDVRAALLFIRCHSAEFRTDSSRIAVLGEDSGAQLAALLAADKAAGLRAALLVGGVYGVGEPPREMPDTLVVHGSADLESSPEAVQKFCREMRGCEYLPVDGGIHRAENWRPGQWGYKERLLEWLGRKLELGNPDHEPHRTNLQKDIVYDAAHGLRLDAWVPPGPGPFPAVIIAHGGGWEAGDKVTYVTPIFEPLAKAGFAWFSIDYRLTPEHRHEDQLADFRSAIVYVRQNASRFSIDTGRIVILGESASGQMAAQLATEHSAWEAPFAAAVSFYGVYDFEPMVDNASLLDRLFGIAKLDEQARNVLRRYSPLHHARKDMVPLLLIHGTNERLWSQGLAMAKKLSDLGAPHELHAIQGAPHGMENWEGHPEWQSYKQKLVAWLGVGPQQR